MSGDEQDEIYDIVLEKLDVDTLLEQRYMKFRKITLSILFLLAFVAYNTAGRERWTPISITGVYLTGLEFDAPGVYDAAGFAKVVQESNLDYAFFRELYCVFARL